MVEENANDVIFSAKKVYNIKRKIWKGFDSFFIIIAS